MDTMLFSKIIRKNGGFSFNILSVSKSSPDPIPSKVYTKNLFLHLYLSPVNNAFSSSHNWEMVAGICGILINVLFSTSTNGKMR